MLDQETQALPDTASFCKKKKRTAASNMCKMEQTAASLSFNMEVQQQRLQIRSFLIWEEAS